MFFHQRFIPGLAIASYMVGDEKAKEVAVIDPTRDVDEFIDIAKREGLRITHILETHVHADFVSGSAEQKARLGSAPQVHSSGMGCPSLRCSSGANLCSVRRRRSMSTAQR